MTKSQDLPESPIPGLRVASLDANSVTVLQRFFDANPEYFLSTTGEVASPTDAYDEVHDALPDGWAFSAATLLGYLNPRNELVAMANVVSDLFASGIWHISTFIVETARHGNGDAQAIYSGLEQWAAANGAHFLRLGVVLGNSRAERFWERQGYQQTRLRHGVELGEQIKTLRVLCKPLSGGTLQQYLQVVERDRPPAFNAAPAGSSSELTLQSISQAAPPKPG